MLKEAFEKQGAWLFRWRSFLPLIIAPFAIAAVYGARDYVGQLGERIDDSWEFVSIAISVIGLLVRAVTVGFAPAGTSGRNTRLQRANQLNTTGLYSIVRHPLYLANFLIFLGFLVALKVWWFPLIGAFAFAVYYERIMMTEEAFLQNKFGRTYEQWAQTTPAFFPALLRWQRPDMPFSWRTTLRREYGTAYLLFAYFVVVEFLSDTVLRGETLRTWFTQDSDWLIGLAAASVAFLSLRFLKKRTHLLDVAGR
ncbi:MAG: isoprenylcysteine carboxylmethyltransferase family protein [Alphaproteobacteria bacterium]